MIFLQWEQVLGLKLPLKTQTRRPVKDGEFDVIDPDHGDIILAVYDRDGTRLKWQLGRTYAVQPGRGKKAVGRVRITKIRRERLGDISIEDVFAEGVAYTVPPSEEWLMVPDMDVARLLYAELWESIYGENAWDRMKDDPVWVLDFELVGGGP